MPKKILFARTAIDNIETVEDAKRWLKTFMRDFDRWYEKLYDHIESGEDIAVSVVAGTAQGQLAFWDNTLRQWVPTETNELFWDDANKRIGIKNASPSSELDVTGTITATRGLFGGVEE